MTEHLTDEALRAAYNRYDAGEKVDDIAKDYGVGGTYLYTHWKKRGIWTGFRAVTPNKRGKISEDEALEAWSRYDSGEFSAAESAKRLGVRADSLRERWRQMGFTLHANKGTQRRQAMRDLGGYAKINEGHPCVTLNGRCLICTDQY